MKIAVVYGDGKVFPHLGMAEAVKFYDIEDGKITSTEIAEMNGPGHIMIARTVFGNQANVLICGGIRPTAANALTISGVELVAGASGDADAAVEAYLAGSLTHDPAACNQQEECGHDD